MSEMAFTEFCQQWNDKQFEAVDGDVEITPYEYGGDVYGAEIRSSGIIYDCDDEEFKKVQDYVARKSGGMATISSTAADFRSGTINLDMSCSNCGFDTEKVIHAIKTLLEDLLPSFKI